jgi:hypothetical protein
MKSAFRRRTAAFVLALATAASPLTTSTTQTFAARTFATRTAAEAPGERHSVILWNYRSSRCVNGPGTDGGNLLLLRCNSGWGHDRWDLIKVKDAAGNDVPSQYFVINTATRACLEIGGRAANDGATGMTFGCHQGTHQIWQLKKKDGTGFYIFKNLGTGKCLDARFVEEWTDVYQWNCHEGGEQRWWIDA